MLPAIRFSRTSLYASCLAFLLFVMLGISGCQTEPDQVISEDGTVPFILITATPSKTAVPSLTSPPTAASTAAPSPSPTITPVVERRLPINWRDFGDDRFGIVIPAPRQWTDATYLLRQSDAIERFGPLQLLLVDTEETANRLMAGVPIGEGAYIFSYVGKSVPSRAEPVDALAQVMVELGIGSPFSGEPISLENMTIPAAYADLSEDLLHVFPNVEQPLLYRLVLYLPENGIPTIMAMAASPGNWELHGSTFSTAMELVELPQTRDRVLGHLGIGETVDGNLLRETKDIWTFNGQRGHFATINLTPSDTRIDLTLSLFDPQGNLLETVDDGYEGDAEVLTDIPLPADGTYIIEAKEFFNEIGRYDLSLVINDEAQYSGGGPITLGQEITSDLVENGEHIWTFDGTASQNVTIILSSFDDQLDVILELFGPDGYFLGLWDESFAGDAEVATGIELPVTGEYSILVHGFAGHGGLYSISLDEGGESTTNIYDAGDLITGDAKREYLREDEAHAWFLNGAEGDDVRIQVRPFGTNMDLEVSLANGALNSYILTVDEHLAGESETISYTLLDDDQYVVTLREFFGVPGEYEITLESTSIKEYEIAGVLPIGEMVESRLTSTLPTAWILDGVEGQVISILLEPLDSERDLILELIDPTGSSAVFLDTALNGLPERLSDFEFTSSGQWIVLVREFFGENSDYRLSISTLAE